MVVLRGATGHGALGWRRLRGRISTPSAAGMLAALLTVGVAGALESFASPSVARADSAQVTGLPAPLQASISASLGRDDPEYRLRRRAAVVTGANPAHGMRLTFDRRGAVVRMAAASVSLRLHALGTGNDLKVLSTGQPRATRNRVAYSHAGVREWYVNGPVGLEQGFTVAARPSSSGAGDLTLAVRVAGARVEQAGAGALLRAGAHEFRYTAPFAVDAQGHSLPVRLAVRGDELLLRVADAAAVYPVTVDPFVQTATLTASNGGGGMAIFVPVAISGDTVVAGGLVDLYVFEKPVSGWQNATETARLSASAPGLHSGARLGIDGDTIVAATQAVYVFVKPASGWRNATETARLTASDGVSFWASPCPTTRCSQAARQLTSPETPIRGPSTSSRSRPPAGRMRASGEADRLGRRRGRRLRWVGCKRQELGNRLGRHAKRLRVRRARPGLERRDGDRWPPSLHRHRCGRRRHLG